MNNDTVNGSETTYENSIIGATDDQLKGFETNTPIENSPECPSLISPGTNDPSPNSGAVALDVSKIEAEFGLFKTEVRNELDAVRALIDQHVNALNEAFAARIKNLEVSEK